MRKYTMLVVGLFVLTIILIACGGNAASDPEMEQLLQERCTTCHLLNYVDRDIAKDQWPSLVDRMIAWGAELNEEERNQLVDYVQKRYGK